MKTRWKRQAIFCALALLLCFAAGCAKPAAKPVADVKPAEAKAPITHSFPESLLDYAAKEAGVGAIDLSGAASLDVQVNHCEYGEPTQTIADADTVAAAAEAIANIVVTGGSDNMSSTGTHYVFAFYDADGAYIAGFAFQDGMLMENDGRYPVSGLDALYAVDGVMLSDAWEAYWEAESEKEDAYAAQYRLQYPASIFGLSGYNASLLADIDPDTIYFVSIRVSWNDEAGKLDTGDPETIRAIYEALTKVQAVGKVGEDDPVGQEWSIRFAFLLPDTSDAIPKSAYLSFEGDYLLSDMLDGGTSMPYTLEGLDGLWDCTDADVLQYLKAYRNTPKPK